MIAGLTSYEAERLTVGRLGNREDAKQMRYFAQDSSEGERKRRKVVVRLRDEMEEVLTYPCRTLAKLYEPLELLIGRSMKYAGSFVAVSRSFYRNSGRRTNFMLFDRALHK